MRDVGQILGSTAAETFIIDLGVAMDAYFDDILLFGLLRNCRKEQVRFAMTDPGISQRFAKLASYGTQLPDAARCELGWAVAREILPAQGFDGVIAGAQSPEALLLSEILMLREHNTI